MAMDTITLKVKRDRNVYIPNAISPNSDGINDAFTVFTDESVKQITSLKIYDRWGDTVASIGPIMPNEPALGWDGNFNGKPMNPGVFVYYIEVLFVDGVSREYSGDLTLLR